MSDQTTHNQHLQDRYAYKMAKIQAREARHMARQVAREARWANRPHRPRQDWSFEVRLGEKVYTFTWRWHGQTESAGEVSSPEQPLQDMPYADPEGVPAE